MFTTIQQQTMMNRFAAKRFDARPCDDSADSAPWANDGYERASGSVSASLFGGGFHADAPSGGAGTFKAADFQRADRAGTDVVLVGMNEASTKEAASLRKRGVDVTHVADAPVNDTIEVEGRTFNLANDSEVDAFAKTLGLGETQTLKVADAIKTAGRDARDETAQLASVWAVAERGGEIPSRLVLSGHSVGDGVWGDNNGTLSIETLGELADAMPKAAGQVEDLHIAGCYSGGEYQMNNWREVFPNAKTIWAYTDAAPSADDDSPAHLAAWDSATRGGTDALHRSAASGVHAGQNVAVWSKAGGYQGTTENADLQDLRDQYGYTNESYEHYFSGELTQQTPYAGELRWAYNDLQTLLQRSDLPADERKGLEAQRDQNIRLLYYSKSVAPNFQAEHSDALAAGFTSVGMSAPDFGALSRKDALAQIAAFEQKLGGMASPPAAATAILPSLTGGLRDLSPDWIPNAWI